MGLGLGLGLGFVSSRVTVDLPLPEGPTSPNRPPGAMRSERPRTFVRHSEV